MSDGLTMSDVALGENPLQRNIISANYIFCATTVARYKETGSCIVGYRSTLRHTCILLAGRCRKKSPQLLQ